MRDELLFGELKKRPSDADTRDDQLCAELQRAIDALPIDVRANASLKARALKSLPWELGREPFDSMVEARQILSRV